jgi:hypothetical protein
VVVTRKLKRKTWRSYLKGHHQAKHVSFKTCSFRCDFDNKFLEKIQQSELRFFLLVYGGNYYMFQSDGNVFR